jgi:hypothetical protein
MTQTSQFDADVAATETEGELTFLYEGKPYIAQRTPIVDKLTMDDAGFEQGFDFTMEVRRSQFVFPIRPPSNLATIKIGEIEYQIVGTTPDQFGVVNTYAVKQKT